jgi:hypothetical protein
MTSGLLRIRMLKYFVIENRRPYEGMIALLVAISFLGASAHAEPVAVGAKNGPRSDSQSDVQPFFFEKIRAAADSGRLFDPSAISNILGIDFQAQTVELEPQPSDCSKEWQNRSLQKLSTIAAESSWYRVLPTGIRNMEVPAAFINRATKSEDAKFSYQGFRAIKCNDRSGLQDHTSAAITFNGLPSFSCISSSDIRRWLPEAEFQMATDGVSLFTYRGKVDDEIGTKIDFVFRMGASCALSASIIQDQFDGLRYRRAISKRRNCEVVSNKTFCNNHEPFGWNDDAVNEMRRFADKACGTVDSLFRLDKEHGTQPDPLPKIRGGVGPCQMYETGS